MSILNQLNGDFSHQVRNRGRQYFTRKAVRIHHADESSINATVQGTELYDVDISWSEDGIEYQCSCGYFIEHDAPCKHIYATLLEAEEQKKLPRQVTTLDRAERDDWDEEDGSDPVIQIGFGNEIQMLSSRGPQSRGPAPTPAKRPERHAIWRRRLGELKSALQYGVPQEAEPWPASRQICYVVDVAETQLGNGLVIDLAYRTSRRGGGLDRPKQLRLGRRQIPTLPEAIDRQIIQMLAGIGRNDYSSYYSTDEVPRRYYLTDSSQNELLRLMCQTGRCHLRIERNEQNPRPISWDETGAWNLLLRVLPTEEKTGFRLDAVLQRGEQQMDIFAPDLMVAGGLVFINGTVATLHDGGAFAFAVMIRREQQITVPVEQGDELLAELMHLPRLPKLDLPADLAVTELRPTPRPRLAIRPPAKPMVSDNRLTCELSFEYDDQTITYSNPDAVVFDREKRRMIHRDPRAEKAAVARLHELGFRDQFNYLDPHNFRLTPKNLPSVVRTLIESHWRVEVEGKVYRQPGQIKIEVSSGIDWFELHGTAEFGDMKVALPKLLAALSKGETSIVLDDGTVGILPEEWLKKYGLLGAMGTHQEDTIQFAKNQVGLLDALLASQPMVHIDETFARARDQLLKFEGIVPADPPATFVGSLRPYQRDGLGWLDFLRSFGLNGCLADDMGLGKTVQVLALLDHRRQLRQSPTNGTKKIGPSLVVVPRSLVFNWTQEANRFAPLLRVLDHATADRVKSSDHFENYDLILTTYGTLRNDVPMLKDIVFDYVILDEAQAIKNPASETAKAARLLRGDYRLVLSGTPVQNHLGELWSLFEFLNPGMLGASRALNMNGGSGRTLDEDSRLLLARALKPFILRRTKEQVAKDLPEKVEQTIYCELDKQQRALYNELKEHYRNSLLTRIATEGIAKSKIQVLEALLRLRQAACHPGLLDKSRISEGSAKLDTLLPRLAEIAGEGHKAIVFSQFTSLLAIVRKKLDAESVVYEYLDGKTRDRQERVNRFQTDENCKLFLISLKAGGVGLNLTAAQYVFLLDPWWNPAVEAQAIDRAHRIGQTKNVFAYRLIAKDTVEEKVLQLQQTKRDLADAIIKADNNLIAKLGREDLELLLS